MSKKDKYKKYVSKTICLKNTCIKKADIIKNMTWLE